MSDNQHEKILRFRLEIEKLRERNMGILKEIDKYDDWLYESVEKIDKLLNRDNSSSSSSESSDEDNNDEFVFIPPEVFRKKMPKPKRSKSEPKPKSTDPNPQKIDPSILSRMFMNESMKKGD